MVYTDRTDVCNNHTPSISDPRQDLGLIPDQSVIEIKWCIRLENEDEIDVVRAFEFEYLAWSLLLLLKLSLSGHCYCYSGGGQGFSRYLTLER